MLVFNAFKKGGSEPYTKTSGCIISEKNGYRESLASEKKMNVVMPHDDANGINFPILLPAGLSLEDFLGMNVTSIHSEKHTCDKIVNGLIDETESGNTFYEFTTGENYYYYDPTTGLFHDQTFYDEWSDTSTADVIDNAPLIAKYMTGEPISLDIDMELTLDQSNVNNSVGRVVLSKPVSELYQDIANATLMNVHQKASDGTTIMDNTSRVAATAGSTAGTYSVHLPSSGDLQFKILNDAYELHLYLGSFDLQFHQTDEEGKVFEYPANE